MPTVHLFLGVSTNTNVATFILWLTTHQHQPLMLVLKPVVASSPLFNSLKTFSRLLQLHFFNYPIERRVSDSHCLLNESILGHGKSLS